MLLSPGRKGVMESPPLDQRSVLNRARSSSAFNSSKDMKINKSTHEEIPCRSSENFTSTKQAQSVRSTASCSSQDDVEDQDQITPLVPTRSKPALMRSNTALLRDSQRSSRAVLPVQVSQGERNSRKQSRKIHRPESIRESVNMTAKQKIRNNSSGIMQTFGLFLAFMMLFAAFIVCMGTAGFNINSMLGPVAERVVPSGYPREELGHDLVDLNFLFMGIMNSDPEQARATVNDLTKITCAVFAIVVQVTAILIQVATREFSTDAIYLFVKDRTLVFSCTFYTFTLAYVIWLTNIINEFYIPRGEILIGSILVLLNVLFIVPYFIYLTRMLNPFRLVHRVAENGLSACLYRESMNLAKVEKNKEVTIWAIENIAQLASNAMQLKKKTLVYTCLEVLSRFTILYGEKKDKWHDEWFKVPVMERETPDFFSLSDDNVSDLESRMTWVEWKVLRQYQNMFHGSLRIMKDACYVIAVNTRMVAEAASRRHDFTTWDLCVKFFNTYIRYGIASGDIRTVYNILHQYRSVALTVLHQDLELLNVVRGKKRRFMAEHNMHFPNVISLLQISGNYVVEEARDIVVAGESRVVTLAHYLIYYSSVGLEHGMGFIAETAAHELASIIETAFMERRECHDELLTAFLSLHQVAQDFMDEIAYWGIRRAHTKLGAVYLRNGSKENAFKIQQSMYEEDREKLLSLWESLAKVNDRDFWEVNDRGTNMNYLSPYEKCQLQEFFAFFGVAANGAILSASVGVLEPTLSAKSLASNREDEKVVQGDTVRPHRDSLVDSEFGKIVGKQSDSNILEGSDAAEVARRKRFATAASPRPPSPVKRNPSESFKYASSSSDTGDKATEPARTIPQKKRSHNLGLGTPELETGG